MVPQTNVFNFFDLRVAQAWILDKISEPVKVLNLLGFKSGIGCTLLKGGKSSCKRGSTSLLQSGFFAQKEEKNNSNNACNTCEKRWNVALV